jgi:AcrR family transcriptional regulator
VSPTERPSLDQAEVVRVALQVLDDEGLDGLTMRSLAERLGVKAASLYWHLRDKDELAELLLEAINAEIRDPDPALPWRERLEQGAWEWRRVLLAHRDAARLAMGRFVARPVTLRRIELVVGALRQAGFTDRDVADAAYLFSNYVPGFVAEESTLRPASPERPQPSTAASAPPVERGRLEIGWARRLTIEADPTLSELFSVFSEDGRRPDIHAQGGVVTLLQTHSRKASTLVLNASVPWDIHAQKGASHMTADLRGLALNSFTVDGGGSAIELTVASPTGTVPIRVTGGTSKVSIHRAEDVPVRLEMRGGVSQLMFDGQKFGSAGQLTVQSPGYDRATDRYEVTLTGGVSKIVLDTVMAPAAQPESATHYPDRQPALLTALSAVDYPNLAALAGPIMSASMDDRFGFGLRVILDGLERRLERVPKG